MPSCTVSSRVVFLLFCLCILCSHATASHQHISRRSLHQNSHIPRLESSDHSTSTTIESETTHPIKPSTTSKTQSLTSITSNFRTTSSKTTTSSSSSSSSTSTFTTSTRRTTSSLSVTATHALTFTPPRFFSSSSQITGSTISSSSDSSASSSQASSSSSSTSSIVSSTTSDASVTTTSATPVPNPTSPGNISDNTSSGLGPTGDPGASETSGANFSSNPSSGFWANKGAVAGTFISVAFVVIGAGTFIFLRAKRRQFEKRTNSDFFERYLPSRTDSLDHGPARALHTQPSMTDLHNQTPMSAHPHRDIHYDNIVPAEIIPVDYGATNHSSYIGYPPSAASYSQQDASCTTQIPLQDYTQQGQQYQVHDDTQRSNPSTNPFVTLARRRTNNPFQVQTERGSYQPSLDSFYGGAEEAGHAVYGDYAV